MAQQDAEIDRNRISALLAHSGTAGTAETRKVVADDSGAVMVNIAGTEPITLVAGTVSEVSNIVKGTITALAKGTISAGTIDAITLPDPLGSVTVTVGTIGDLDTVGTVGLVESGTIAEVGTLTGLGTVTNLGSVTNAGTVKEVANLAKGTVTALAKGTISAGTIDAITLPDPLGSVVVTVGTIGDLDTVGTLGVVEGGTLAELGTLPGLGTTTNLGSVTNVGTVKGVDGVANLAKGTITALAKGTISAGTIGTVGDLKLAHTIGTVGSIVAVGQVHNAGTIAALPDPLGSVVVTVGTISDLDTLGTVGVVESGTVETNVLPLSGVVLSTAVAIGTTATAIPASALSNRKSLITYNSGTTTVYLGGTGVATTDFPLGTGDYGPPVDLGASALIYGVAGTAGGTVVVMEVS